MDPSPDADKSEAPEVSLKSVEKAAAESQKLLRFIASQLTRLFTDKSLPLQLKLFLVPLLFMIPLYSLMILVFFGDLLYCIARSKEMHSDYYLIFLGTTMLMTAVLLLAFGAVANKFENTRALEEQLQEVTNARRPRRRARREER
jgi:hypothetical protein